VITRASEARLPTAEQRGRYAACPNAEPDRFERRVGARIIPETRRLCAEHMTVAEAQHARLCNGRLRQDYARRHGPSGACVAAGIALWILIGAAAGVIAAWMRS